MRWVVKNRVFMGIILIHGEMLIIGPILETLSTWLFVYRIQSLLTGFFLK
jgi:hypothetical protein